MTTHPEDQKNTTLLIARRVGANVDLSWPDNLALARYLWKKLRVAIARAEFTERETADDDDEIVAEVKGDTIVYGVPKDLRLALFLWHELDNALCDKEWAMYVEAENVRAKMMENAARKVELGDVRTLKSLKLRRN